jgi:hypothetical protein
MSETTINPPPLPKPTVININKVGLLGFLGIALLIVVTFFVARNSHTPVVVHTDLAAVEKLIVKHQPAPNTLTPAVHESVFRKVLDEFFQKHKNDNPPTFIGALEELKKAFSDIVSAANNDVKNDVHSVLNGIKNDYRVVSDDIKKDTRLALNDLKKDLLAALSTIEGCHCKPEPKPTPTPTPKPTNLANWYCGYFIGNVFYYSEDNKPKSTWSNWAYYYGYFSKDVNNVKTFYYSYVYLPDGQVESCNGWKGTFAR